MRNDADLNKQLQQMYADSLNDINSQIDQFYMRYAGANGITKQEAMKRVAAEDVQAFSKKAKKLVAFKDFSKEANEQLKLYNATMRINRLEMLKSQVGEQLIALGNEQQAVLQKKFTADYLDEIKRQAGILGQDRNEDLVGRVNAVVNGSWQKATWSSRLWDSMAELQATIGIQLNRFMVQGLNPRVIARQLKPLLSETVQNRTAIAERLARTESARVQDAASMAMFKKYGVKQVKWVAEPSACKQCRDISSYNHGIYQLDDVPMIPAHPNCRCAKAAYTANVDLTGEKSESNELVNELKQSNLFDMYGKTLGNKAVDKLAGAPDIIKRQYETQGKNLYYTTKDASKPWTNANGIHMTSKQFTAEHQEEMQQFFHETAHYLDSKPSKIGALQPSRTVELKETLQNDFHKYVYGDLPTLEGLGKRPRKNSKNYAEWVQKKDDWYSATQEAEKAFEFKIAEWKKLDSKITSDLSDMIEAVDPIKYNKPMKSGHGYSYWQTAGNQEMEFFAELSSELVANPEALKLTKEVFPNAVKKYEEIAAKIISRTDLKHVD